MLMKIIYRVRTRKAKNIKNTDILDEMKNISIMLGTLTKNISNSVILAAE